MKTKNLWHPTLLSLCHLISTEMHGQVLAPPPLHSYEKIHNSNRIPPKYAHLREADVMWSKRVWRRIDLHQKMNLPYYYPIKPIEDRLSLFEVITNGIFKEGTITAYSPGPLGNNDEFTLPMTNEDAFNRVVTYDSIEVYIIDRDVYEWMPDTQKFTSADVRMYEVMEEWFFDKQRSVMDVRIIGICPLVEKRDNETGEVRGLMPIFWVYFPQLRYELAKYEAFNRQNGVRLTYDDMFQKRFFDSYIIKEDNVYDRFISEYRAGLDALLEADQIKNEIFTYEHDLWHY